MQGKQFYQKIHMCVCLEEHVFIRVLQCHPGKNLHISTLSLKKLRVATHHFTRQESGYIDALSSKKLENGYAPFRYHIGFTRNEASTKSA